MTVSKICKSESFIMSISDVHINLEFRLLMKIIRQKRVLLIFDIILIKFESDIV